MEHKIAINPQGGNRGMIAAMTLEDYDRVTHSEVLAKLIAAVRSAKDDKTAKALKDKLPFRSPHFAAFADNKRDSKHIIHEAFLFQTCVDVDDPDIVESTIVKAKELDKKPGMWRDKLLHMEYSARKKLHIDIRLPLGLTIEEAQQDYCKTLGIDYDKSCITPERMIYITPASDEIYRSEHWYEVMSDEDREMYCDALNNSKLNAQPSTLNSQCNHNSQPSTLNSQCYIVFDLVRELAGLKDVDINAVGSRHNCLKSIMSAGASRLMSAEELMAVVRVRMPEYSQEKDCQDLIRDFYEKYHDDSKILSRDLQNILSIAEKKGQCSNINGQSSNINGQSSKAWETFNFNRLPHGLRETMHGNPHNMFMPILTAVLPLAASYADGVSFRYCDNKLQRLNLSSIIVGPPASGKSACKDAVNLWRQQMKEHDAQEWERQEQWKEECKRNKGGKEKDPENPKVCILNPPITISNSSLLTRFKQSCGHTLYSFGEELDTLYKSNGAGNWAQKYDIYRLAFDNGEWGQDYKGEQSESGVVNVKYNFSILGTYGAVRKCFRKDNVENGLSSRIMIAEMPDNSFAPMPHYTDPTAKDLTAIDEAVTKLRQAKGFIDTPRLRRKMAQWVENERITASKSMDHIIDAYRKRAAVIGLRCGVIALILEGKESRAVLDFATLMASYVLYEQCHVFGNMLTNVYRQASDEGQRMTLNHNIFDQLPPEFSIEQLAALKGSDTTVNAMKTIIYRWKKDGWITKIARNKWQKQK